MASSAIMRHCLMLANVLFLILSAIIILWLATLPEQLCGKGYE